LYCAFCAVQDKFVDKELRILCVFSICMYICVCRRLSAAVEVKWSTRTASDFCLMDAALPGDAALDQADAVDQTGKDKKKKNM